MKKTIITLITVFSIYTASSQANFGIQVGGNFANGNWVEDGLKLPTKTKIGLSIGFVSEIELAKSFYFRPEVNFVQKGAKYTDSDSYSNGMSSTSYTSSTKINLSYIEVPLNFCFNVPAGSGQLMFGAGPSIGIGVGGTYNTTSTTKTNGQSQTESYSTTIKFDGVQNENASDESIHLKSIDFSLGFSGGYRLNNGLIFTAGYNVGLVNISPDAYADIKNKGFALKLYYMFNKK